MHLVLKRLPDEANKEGFQQLVAIFRDLMNKTDCNEGPNEKRSILTRVLPLLQKKAQAFNDDTAIDNIIIELIHYWAQAIIDSDDIVMK